MLKPNYGMYRVQPGRWRGRSANPNQSVKSLTYQWTDDKVVRHLRARRPGVSAGRRGRPPRARWPATPVDPEHVPADVDQATVFLERQLTEGVGARVGFVYFTVKNQIGTLQPLRPAGAYSVPFTFLDRGEDGFAGRPTIRT